MTTKKDQTISHLPPVSARGSAGGEEAPLTPSVTPVMLCLENNWQKMQLAKRDGREKELHNAINTHTHKQTTKFASLIFKKAYFARSGMVPSVMPGTSRCERTRLGASP